MDAEALISNLPRRGIRMWLESSDKVGVEPAALLTDQDRQAIRTLKPQLLEFLRCAGSGEANSATPADDPLVCGRCGPKNASKRISSYRCRAVLAPEIALEIKAIQANRNEVAALVKRAGLPRMVPGGRWRRG